MQVVLITGASTGIGRDAAVYLADRGFRVLAGVRKESDAQSIRDEGRANLQPVTIDVTDDASVAACVESVSRVAGEQGLHALVNNAGIVIPAPLEYVPLDEFTRQMEVNVTGQLRVTQAFMPLIRKGQGRIVFVGSASGYFAAPFTGPYCASKFALEGLVHSLRRELLPWKIPVVMIQPGAIETPIWDKSTAVADAIADRLPEEAMAEYEQPIAGFKRFLNNKVVAGAAPVAVVSRAVFHAVAAARPNTHYRIGSGAQLQWVASRLLPVRFLDWVVGRTVLGLGS